MSDEPGVADFARLLFGREAEPQPEPPKPEGEADSTEPEPERKEIERDEGETAGEAHAALLFQALGGSARKREEHMAFAKLLHPEGWENKE
jgi:hypothetical protein